VTDRIAALINAPFNGVDEAENIRIIATRASRVNKFSGLGVTLFTHSRADETRFISLSLETFLLTSLLIDMRLLVACEKNSSTVYIMIGRKTG